MLPSSHAPFRPSTSHLVGLVAVLAFAWPCRAQIHVPGHYPTIQQAVDAAASGATIIVAAGHYQEQVIISDKNLILQGQPGATLVSPPTLDEVSLGGGGLPRRPVLAAVRCNVDIDGFTFDGLRRGLPRFTGALYAGSGGTVSNCTFTGFRSPPSAPPPPFPERAFQLVNPILPGTDVVEIAIRACSFTDNVDSIVLFGDGGINPNAVRVRCHVADNTVVGLGPQRSPQNGIFAPTGTTGIILNNHVSNHVFLGSGNFSIGIITGSLGNGPGFEMPGLQIVGNTTVNNTIGILSLFANGNQIVKNSVTGGRFAFSGIVASGRDSHIIGNSIEMRQSIVGGNSGIALLGAEFNGTFGSGFALDTHVIANTIQGAVLPVWSQTGVTGTKMYGNVILP